MEIFSDSWFWYWYWELFPVFFVGMWLLISVLLAALGGWHTLAQYYSSPSPFLGKRLRFRSAQFKGYVNYGGCLTLGSSPAGFYIAVLPLFRLGHPSLLIPWSDVTAHEARSWLFSSVDINFMKAPGTSIRLPRRLAQALFDASGSQVPIQPTR